MSGAAFPCCTDPESGPTAGFTKAHFSQKTATNKTNAPNTIRKNRRTLRLKMRISPSRIAGSGLRRVAAHFGGDPEGCDENEDVRQVDKNIGLQRDLIQVGVEIDGHVDQIPGPQNVEIHARAARRSERADHAEGSSTEVSEVDDSRHVEQAEHQAVRIHDSRNVVEKIDAKKQRGKSPGTLLNCCYLFRHSKLSGSSDKA